MSSEAPPQEDEEKKWRSLLAPLEKYSPTKNAEIEKNWRDIELSVHEFCKTVKDKKHLVEFCRAVATYNATRPKFPPPESPKSQEDQKRILRAVPCGVLAVAIARMKGKPAYNIDPIDQSVRKLLSDTSTRAAAMKDLVETMKEVIKPGHSPGSTDEEQKKRDLEARRRSKVITTCLDCLNQEIDDTDRDGSGPPPPMLSYMHREISDIQKKLDLGLRNNNISVTSQGSITGMLSRIKEKLSKAMNDVMEGSDNKGEQVSGATAGPKPKGGMKGPPFYFLSLTGESEWNMKRQPCESGSQSLLSPYLLSPGDSDWEWKKWQENLKAFSPTLETKMISVENVFVEFEPQRQMAMYQHKKLWKRAAKAKIAPYPGILVFTMGAIQWDLRGLDNQSDSTNGRVDHMFLIPFGSIVSWAWKDIPGGIQTKEGTVEGRYLIIQTQDMNYRFYPICVEIYGDCESFLNRFVGSHANPDDDKMRELLRAERMRKLEKEAVSVVDDMVEKQSFPATCEFYSDCFESFFKRVIVKNNREIKKTLERATERLCGFTEEEKESSDFHKWNVWLLEAMRRFCVRKPEYVAIVLKKADALRVRKEDAKAAIAEFVELFTRDDEVLITNGLKNQAAQLRKAVCGTERENGTWSYSNYSLDRIRRIIPRDDLDIIDKGRCRYAAAFKAYLRTMYTGKTISFMDITNEGQ